VVQITNDPEAMSVYASIEDHAGADIYGDIPNCQAPTVDTIYPIENIASTGNHIHNTATLYPATDDGVRDIPTLSLLSGGAPCPTAHTPLFHSRDDPTTGAAKTERLLLQLPRNMAQDVQSTEEMLERNAVAHEQSAALDPSPAFKRTDSTPSSVESDQSSVANVAGADSSLLGLLQGPLSLAVDNVTTGLEVSFMNASLLTSSGGRNRGGRGDVSPAVDLSGRPPASVPGGLSARQRSDGNIGFNSGPAALGGPTSVGTTKPRSASSLRVLRTPLRSRRPQPAQVQGTEPAETPSELEILATFC
jgi:hypothetical protein